MRIDKAASIDATANAPIFLLRFVNVFCKVRVHVSTCISVPDGGVPETVGEGGLTVLVMGRGVAVVSGRGLASQGGGGLSAGADFLRREAAAAAAVVLGWLGVAAGRRGVAGVGAADVTVDMEVVRVPEDDLGGRQRLVDVHGPCLCRVYARKGGFGGWLRGGVVFAAPVVVAVVVIILVVRANGSQQSRSPDARRWADAAAAASGRGGRDGGGGGGGHGLRVLNVLLAQHLEVLAQLVVPAVVAPVGTATPAARDIQGPRALDPTGRGGGGGVLAVLSGPIAAQLGPGAQVILEEVLAVVLLAHDEELAVVHVSQVLKVLDGEVVPLHEEDAGHEAVGDEHADAGEAVLAKLAPQALVEAAHAVIGVGGALAVGDAVEEVPVVGALLPHALHLVGAGLEVAKVLLAEPRLLVHLDVGPAEGGRLRVVGRERLEDALGRLTGAPVGRREEVERVVRPEEVAEATAGFAGLYRPFWRELDSVVGDRLVYLPLL